MIAIGSLIPVLGGAVAVGGVVTAISGRRELLIRWCCWAVALPVITGAYWLGEPGVTVLAVVIAVVAALEFGALTHLPWPDRAVLACAVTSVVLTSWLAPGQEVRAAAVGALTIAVVPLLAGDSSQGLRRLGTSLLGLIWLSTLAALAPLGTTSLALFIAVSIGDITAYFTGQRLGGPKLSPHSPAKRWSGTVSGAAAALSVLTLLSALSFPTALAVTIGAPAGDLLESMIKRGAQAKDSAHWLAGSGGLLDRIDSLLLSLPILVLLR
ncbi:phosphatidate cytidylyltransferase [Streptomyces virginiae]|uniref:phosphatidate cytidylyltransferase n=1 Tax=Streptomyces virginiae TaxID=1961 RepID=UPI00099C7D67|nr:phosphatidate cytidylyltransferase [Streptomyces virginiae]